MKILHEKHIASFIVRDLNYDQYSFGLENNEIYV